MQDHNSGILWRYGARLLAKSIIRPARWRLGRKIARCTLRTSLRLLGRFRIIHYYEVIISCKHRLASVEDSDNVMTYMNSTDQPTSLHARIGMGHEHRGSQSLGVHSCKAHQGIKTAYALCRQPPIARASPMHAVPYVNKNNVLWLPKLFPLRSWIVIDFSDRKKFQMKIDVFVILMSGCWIWHASCNHRYTYCWKYDSIDDRSPINYEK